MTETTIVDPASALPTPRASLVLTDVIKAFGGRTVSDIPHLEIGRHGVEGLIGPNGAGKTTLTKLITGAHRVDRGTIIYHGPAGSVDISRLPSHRIARAGVVKSNQVIQDFETLTIRDSLLLAAASPRDEKFWRLGRRRADAAVQAEIDGYLEYFQFENPDRHALSGGEKKLLDILRCLLVKPKFLLLDEPTAGLPQFETDKVKELVRRLGAEGEMSILIIEHDLELMWSVCDYVHFMAEGKVLLQGTPDQVRRDPTVIEKYLGGGHA